MDSMVRLPSRCGNHSVSASFDRCRPNRSLDAKTFTLRAIRAEAARKLDRDEPESALTFLQTSESEDIPF
jgi:hypothetical protein